HEVIEKLLILQDRDRRLMRVKDQLARVEPERQMLQARTGSAQASLDDVKMKIKLVETERKKFELEVEAKKSQIEKYSLQQFQTKKNEEYRALAHEIETCRAGIGQLEDQQLELMEKADGLQKELAGAARGSDEARKLSDGQLKELADREQNLKVELAELESNREQLTSVVEEGILKRYERLLRNKGDSVVVGIQHGVCGGCHMKFPVQLVVACQAAQEMVTCPNCGRILYYTRDMDLAVAE
ncbi:MAG TPA: C4-type zinc ribbon domain-containing protein, partial [Candidatus Saccharimonadales bacterium]|nr:C4-type zinc ribbon domain-containing protein [Candidatus Saccharimonadales bacterium]